MRITNIILEALYLPNRYAKMINVLTQNVQFTSQALFLSFPL
jgi:hypothetical protein